MSLKKEATEKPEHEFTLDRSLSQGITCYVCICGGNKEINPDYREAQINPNILDVQHAVSLSPALFFCVSFNYCHPENHPKPNNFKTCDYSQDCWEVLQMWLKPGQPWLASLVTGVIRWVGYRLTVAGCLTPRPSDLATAIPQQQNDGTMFLPSPAGGLSTEHHLFLDREWSTHALNFYMWNRVTPGFAEFHWLK